MKKDSEFLKKLCSLLLSPITSTVKKIGDDFSLFFAERRYKHSAYAKSTGKSLKEIKSDYGAMGEYLVSDALRSVYGKWLFNLYLPHNGDFTEVDAVFVGHGGVFVIESKNFKGRIYGQIDQKEWFHTYKSRKGIRKTRFFNPIMQNGAHEKAILHILKGNMNLPPLHPMVVFGRDSELYTPVAEQLPKQLLSVKNLKKCVRKFGKNALSKEEIEEVYQILLPYAQEDFDQKMKHIQTVTSKRYNRFGK